MSSRLELKRKILSHPRHLFPLLGLEIPPHVVSWLNFFLCNRNAQVVAAMGHRKSWTVCVFLLWCLLKDPDVRIGIVSNSVGQAQGSLMFIRQQIEDNQDLIAVFGELKPLRKKIIKWGNSELQVLRSSPGRDPTIYAGGISSGINNRRFDIMVMDDFPDPDPKKQESIAHRDHEWNMAMQVSQTRVENKSTAKHPYYGTKVIGTYSHHDDFNKRLQTNADFATMICPAINEDGSLLDPMKWTMDDLLEKKQALGPHAFAMKYLCEVHDKGMTLFDYDSIRNKCWDVSLRFCQSMDTIPEGMKVYMGVDPAIGQGDDASYFVILTIAVDKEGNRQIIDIVRDRKPFPEQVSIIKAKYHIYKPHCIVVENNAYQIALIQGLEAGDGAIPVKAHHTGAAKADPMRGVPSLALIVDQGRLKMPRGGTKEIELCDIFTRELVEYPAGKTTDLVMAWYLLEQGIGADGNVNVTKDSPLSRRRPRTRRQARWHGI